MTGSRRNYGKEKGDPQGIALGDTKKPSAYSQNIMQEFGTLLMA
jgi:hypothetical protein